MSIVLSDKVYQLLAHGRWCTPASSTTKTGRHNITESCVKHQNSNSLKFAQPSGFVTLNLKICFRLCVPIGLVWVVRSSDLTHWATRAPNFNDKYEISFVEDTVKGERRQTKQAKMSATQIPPNQKKIYSTKRDIPWLITLKKKSWKCVQYSTERDKPWLYVFFSVGDNFIFFWFENDRTNTQENKKKNVQYHS
jgi:hypothetical protein